MYEMMMSIAALSSDQQLAVLVLCVIYLHSGVAHCVLPPSEHGPRSTGA